MDGSKTAETLVDIKGGPAVKLPLSGAGLEGPHAEVT